MSFNCKECGESYESLKSLHSHIKKHDMILGDYYVKHFQRKNKLTGSLIQFKNYEDYFERDFATYDQMVEWCETAPESEVKPYILDLLKKRIANKKLKHGPSTVDLFSCKMPPIRFYQKLFGSYSKACEECGVSPMFASAFPQEFHRDCTFAKIYIDTREQQPLKFDYSQPMKLDVGDYAINGEDFKYTYVDRKSFPDFCNTMTTEYKRFARELQRCRGLDSFLFVVVECDLYKIEKINSRSPKRYNLNYVFHNMRDLQNEFSDCCQFVFSGNRSNSQLLIPKLLMLGPKIWRTDVQYFLDRGEMQYYNKK
jgi:hypothetical protein